MKTQYTIPAADDQERVLNVLQCVENFLEDWSQDGDPSPESRENFQARSADLAAVKVLLKAAPALLIALQTIALHAPSLDAQGVRDIADAAIAQATGGQPAPTDPRTAVIAEALDAWRAEFDGEAADLHVSGADLVDWFAGWRERAKAAIGTA